MSEETQMPKEKEYCGNHKQKQLQIAFKLFNDVKMKGLNI